MQIILFFLSFLVTVFWVIGLHEIGHFTVARWLGVKVLCFSIGFGKTLYRWQDRNGMEYSIGLIPLGGYVKMLDDTLAPVTQEEQKYAFNHQPFYKKFLIIAAGPCTNLLCALILYWGIFTIGFMAPIPIIGQVIPNSIAAEGNLQPHDQILQVDNKTTKTWKNVLFQILNHAGAHDKVTVNTLNRITGHMQYHHLNLKNWHLNEFAPDPLKELGIQPYAPSISLTIAHIDPNSPAERAGLQVNDRVYSIGQQIIHSWEQAAQLIAHHPHDILNLSVLRHHHLYHFHITPEARHHFFKKYGYLGIRPYIAAWPPSLLQKVQYNIITAWQPAGEEMKELITFHFTLVGKLLRGQLSLHSLGGPVTIFHSAHTALNDSWIAFLSFLAFLSVSVAVINIFPIPGLDGGHLLFHFIEWIAQRPIPLNIQLLTLRLGFAFLLFIMVQAFINDMVRFY